MFLAKLCERKRVALPKLSEKRHSEKRHRAELSEAKLLGEENALHLRAKKKAKTPPPPSMYWQQSGTGTKMKVTTVRNFYKLALLSNVLLQVSRTSIVRLPNVE